MADTIHDFEIGLKLAFFTGTLITAKSQLTFTTVDADGDGAADDGVASYTAAGLDSSISVLNVDGDTLETTAGIFNIA